MNDKDYGTGISALIREALLNAVNGRVPYTEVERIARVFINDRLKRSDTIVTSDGLLFTRTGQLYEIVSLDWCIYYGIVEPECLGDALGYEAASEVALSTIDTVSENRGKNPAWLTLLDGTSFARCYRVHDVLYTETMADPNHLVSLVRPATHYLHVREMAGLNAIGELLEKFKT